MTVPGDATPARAEVESTLTSEILKVHEDSYGTGANDIQTHNFDDNVLVIMLRQLHARRHRPAVVRRGATCRHVEVHGAHHLVVWSAVVVRRRQHDALSAK